ncbi:SH3 domain-containing protein [Devosia crocina]|uniref:SH3 domain-containing protein n=1 Tax=Devosia crocina TaxID=429728 RepID=A0A1I7N5C7_9HYPH|nr:beta/gamma crystallin domain-containing protein [Devosia crocina]SFV29874.1 SH3 domain-containing protein [Devosia crocina]
MKLVAASAALAIGLLAGVSSASAAPAFANSGADVRQGPSYDSPVIGYAPQGAKLDANCDPRGWCQVTGTDRRNSFAGWMESRFVTFSDAGIEPAPPRAPRPPAPQPFPGGNNGPNWSFDFNFGNPVPPPRPQPQPPRPQPVYEEAGACFFTERNFRGASFCLEEGQQYARLPRDWNDRIRSVEVYGGASVDLCSDNNFYGNCVTVRSDTGRLPSGVERRVSSVEVYY